MGFFLFVLMVWEEIKVGVVNESVRSIGIDDAFDAIDGRERKE